MHTQLLKRCLAMEQKPWRFLGFILLIATTLLGCAGARQEISDDSRNVKKAMAQGEASYEKREYLGLTSDKQENWNSTDWSMWMDTHGGGR